MSLLVLGATSRIASAVAERYAVRGDDLVLAGRDVEELERLADHLRSRHDVPVDVVRFDALDVASHAEIWATIRRMRPDLDEVLLAFGTLGAPDVDNHDGAAAQRTVAANFDGAVSILTNIAADFEARGRGTIAVVGSVAGDRGRASNYVYGSAKAGLTAFLSGLRQRLHGSGVNVLTIKPGFVDTPMTSGMPLPPALTASAERAAATITTAMRQRQNRTIYVPFFWRYILWIIRLIPEPLFVRLKL